MNLRRLPIFVYGTLQRGEEREKCWPYRPERIELATIRGTLYDLGLHPAVTHGDGVVAGELWHIAADYLAETLFRLDEVEGFRQPHQDDWYRREVVKFYRETGPVGFAYAYFYARTGDLARFSKVQPDERGVCYWRRFHRGTGDGAGC